MENFFQEYREHRKQHSITLEEISERTKINIRFLEAIEEGNFDVLPETYLRLFLRAYAVEIGVDPDEAIEKYELHRGYSSEEQIRREPKRAEEPPDTFEPESYETDTSVDLSSGPNINWKRTAVVIVIAGFIIWAVKSYVADTTSDPGPQEAGTVQTTQVDSPEVAAPVAENAENPISDEQFDDGEVVDSSQHEFSPVTPESEIELRFEAVDRTWVRVKRDTLPSEEYIFLPQDTKLWTANNRIQLRIGNSAGARLILNDEVIDSLGAPNTVTDLIINRSGIMDKTTVIPTDQVTQPDTTTD